MDVLIVKWMQFGVMGEDGVEAKECAYCGQCWWDLYALSTQYPYRKECSCCGAPG